MHPYLERRIRRRLHLDSTWGIWFRGRNTPHVVEASDRAAAISKARESGCAGHDQPVVSARQLKGRSLTQARKGEWVRERAGSEQTTAAGAYKYRPQLKSKARGHQV
jgi:hypothetical protein